MAKSSSLEFFSNSLKQNVKFCKCKIFAKCKKCKIAILSSCDAQNQRGDQTAVPVCQLQPHLCSGHLSKPHFPGQRVQTSLCLSNGCITVCGVAGLGLSVFTLTQVFWWFSFFLPPSIPPSFPPLVPHQTSLQWNEYLAMPCLFQLNIRLNSFLSAIVHDSDPCKTS